jgi:adenylate cyclase
VFQKISHQDDSETVPATWPSAKIAVALVLAILTAFALIAASWASLLPEAQDRALYDWRSYYLTSPAEAQRNDIALVLINEDSLTNYPALSPVDRGLIAELVRTIDTAGAKIIGLDFLVDRSQSDGRHQALVDAIRDNPKIVQATFLAGSSRPHELAFQEHFLAETRVKTGHLYFASERNRFSLGDQAVRYRIPEGIGDPPRPSFARAIAETAGYEVKMPPSPLITWQRPPQGSTDLFPTFVIRPHRDENGNRIREPLSPRSLALLSGKIVLIGGAFSDRDRHLTPWTVASGERIPGVEVHAQILANLIDGNWTREAEWWWELPLLILIFCAGFYAAQRWKLSGSGIATSVVAFAALILAGIGLYWALKVMLPSATIILAWSAGLFFGSTTDWGLARFQRWLA